MVIMVIMIVMMVILMVMKPWLPSSEMGQSCSLMSFLKVLEQYDIFVCCIQNKYSPVDRS